MLERCGHGRMVDGDDQDDQKGSASRTTCKLHVDMRNGRLELLGRVTRPREGGGSARLSAKLVTGKTARLQQGMYSTVSTWQ